MTVCQKLPWRDITFSWHYMHPYGTVQTPYRDIEPIHHAIYFLKFQSLNSVHTMQCFSQRSIKDFGRGIAVVRVIAIFITVNARRDLASACYCMYARREFVVSEHAPNACYASVALSILRISRAENAISVAYKC